MKLRVGNITQILNEIKRKGFFHLLSANLLIQAVAFASQLFVAGILSPEDIGRIKFIQTLLSVFSIFAGMGFSASTLKLCSENRTETEKQQLLSSAFVLTLFSTIGFYVLVLILNWFDIFSKDLLIKWLIPIGLFPLISNSLFMVLISYFQANKQIKLLSSISISNKLLSIIAIVIFTFFFGIKGYYVAYNVSFILMLIVAMFLLKNNLHFRIPVANLRKLFSVHNIHSLPSFIANLLSEISAYADILLINYFVNDLRDIGFYSFAVTLTILLRVFPGTVQQIASPYFSSLATDKVSFKKVFVQYNKQLYITVTVTLILALLFAHPVLNFIFSSKYNDSIPFFYLLAIGWSFRQLNQLQSAAIFGLGKIKYNVYISLISLIFNVLLCVLLINKYGIIGAAWASIPGGIVIWLVSYLYMKKALKDK